MWLRAVWGELGISGTGTGGGRPLASGEERGESTEV